MTNLIDLNNITDFFKPNRQVWDEAEPAGGNVDTDSDADINPDDANADTDYEPTPEMGVEEEGFSFEDLAKALAKADQAIKFKDKAKTMCDETKSDVECSLAKMKEIQEVARLRDFVNELYEKFLYKMEGGKKIKDTFQRLQALKNSCDMERIIQCFQKAKSYEIKAYSDAEWRKNPDLVDQVIFTYKDGKTEVINLELTTEEKKKVFTPFINGLAELVRKHDEWMEAEKGRYDLSDKISGYTGGVLDIVTSASEEESEKTIEKLNAIREKYQEQYEEDVRNVEELIERASNLNTQDAAYDELIGIAPNLPSSFLEDISEPLSQYADVISGYEVTDGTMPDITFEDIERGKDILQNIQDILVTHFGENYKESMTPEQRADLAAISEKFGMM